MINAAMVKELNAQINAELYSAYLYLAMAAWFEADNWPGFAHWMKVQAKEEQEHAMKIYEYVNDRGGRVVLDAIEAPASKWKDAHAAFEAVLKHERHVTSLIHKLVAVADKLKDTATSIFLQWFVNEQVEEEKNADELVQILARIKGSPNGLFMLDRQLGKRED
jgi:ferritin